MQHKPLTLSIVIPAYNEERHLKACLDSIAAQTVKPKEVIVVDNNSTDKTTVIAGRYPFVRLLKEKCQGVVFARDRGFSAVKSEIIGRIDADTILGPYWCESVLEFYADPKHRNHAFTGGSYFYNVRLPKFSSWAQEQLAFRMNRLLLGHYITYGSNMALPASLWRDVKTSVCHRADIHEDLDLAIHLHRRGYLITYQATHEVGVKMRRVHTNRHELWENMQLWPQTLKVHDNKNWIFGWFGAVLLYLGAPVIVWAEKLARFSGRKPLD